MNDRFAFRATRADTANLIAIADILRKVGRGSFLSITDTVRTALTVTAHLAREGTLPGVLTDAKDTR